MKKENEMSAKLNQGSYKMKSMDKVYVYYS